jgi:hypothetical protein
MEWMVVAEIWKFQPRGMKIPFLPFFPTLNATLFIYFCFSTFSPHFFPARRMIRRRYESCCWLFGVAAVELRTMEISD